MTRLLRSCGGSGEEPKGSHEILFAVSESFGGWGLSARFEDLEGIRLQAP
jgi:hypothetical protein